MPSARVNCRPVPVTERLSSSQARPSASSSGRSFLRSSAVRGLCWVTRNFHRLPGRWRLVRWLDRQEQVFATLGLATVRFTRGYRARVDPADENGRRIYVNGYQPQERLTRHFIRLLRPGDGVIDVGANVGYYTLVAARLVGPAGCVHAFEPSPRVLPLLRTNAALSPHANIRVHGVAVTDRSGEITFHVAGPDRTGYSSIRDLGSDGQSVTLVRTVALDALLDGLPPVRLVKIDVEGAELLVLRGMEKLLARDRPHLILEVDDGFLRELGAGARELCAFLWQRGYGLERIGARGALQPLQHPPADRCNILARPPEDTGLSAVPPPVAHPS